MLRRPCFPTSKAWTLRLLLAACAISLFTACGESEQYANYGRVQHAVAGGHVDTDEKWLGVVYLRTKIGKRTQLCSGTLIAPDVVVTAMHCVAPLGSGEFQCDYAGNAKSTVAGAGQLGHAVEPELVEVRVGVDAVNNATAARGKRVFTTNSAHICTNDLAVVLLDTELDLPVTPLRLTHKTTLGEALTIVGYGMSEEDHADTTRRYRENVRVADLGTDSGSDQSSAAPPRTLVVGPSACQGDSGGPAFALNKAESGDPEQSVIVGVNSIAIGQCGANDARSVFTRLEPFHALFDQAFEAAGRVVWQEGQTFAGEPLPEPKPEPKPKPDTNENSKPRRLTRGCSTQPTVSSPAPTWVMALGLLGYVVLVRRKTTPISRR